MENLSYDKWNSFLILYSLHKNFSQTLIGYWGKDLFYRFPKILSPANQYIRKINHTKYEVLALEFDWLHQSIERNFTEYHEYTALFKIGLLAPLCVPFVHFSTNWAFIIPNRRLIIHSFGRKSHTRLSTILSFFSHKTNKHSTDQRSQLNHSNAGQYRTVRYSMLHRNFICWLVGYGAKVGDRWRPMTVANRALKGRSVGSPVISSREGSTTVGGPRICIVEFPCASAHMCTSSTHVYVGFDPCLIARPHSPVALAQLLFSRAKERRLSTSSLLDVFNQTFCRRLLLSPSKCCNYIYKYIYICCCFCKLFMKLKLASFGTVGFH